MARHRIFRKAILALPFVGVLLVSYSAARPALADLPELGRKSSRKARPAEQLLAPDANGFDGEADGSGAFPKLAGQFPQYLAKRLKVYPSGTRQNAIMQPIAKGWKDAEIDIAAKY